MKISVLRQTHIVASIMVFTGFFGSQMIHPNFIYLVALVGFGLALDGLTGFCPMVKILERMPWNKIGETKNQSCCE